MSQPGVSGEESVGVREAVSSGGAKPKTGGRRVGDGEPDSDRISFLTREIEKMKAELERLKGGTRAGDASDRQTLSARGRPLRSNGVKYVPMDMSQYRQSSFEKYFVVNFANETKRRINPFKAFKEIEMAIGGKLADMTSMNRTALLVTVSTKQQGDELLKLKRVDGKECTVEAHKTMNTSKGLVYITEFDINEDELLEGLSDQSVTKVQEASWIKLRRPGAKAFLVTFNTETPPEFVRIPGESLRTRVTEYFDRPKQCKNCQEYGHTARFCFNLNNPRCGRCSLLGHGTTNCTSEEIKCYYCGEKHTAWNKKCSEYIFQSEVLQTQRKGRMSRKEAVRVVSERFPNRRTTFASTSRPKNPASQREAQRTVNTATGRSARTAAGRNETSTENPNANFRDRDV